VRPRLSSGQEPGEGWILIAEAAKRLGVTTAAIRSRILHGSLEGRQQLGVGQERKSRSLTEGRQSRGQRLAGRYPDAEIHLIYDFDDRNPPITKRAQSDVNPKGQVRRSEAEVHDKSLWVRAYR
jgi:hypothetical protein